MLAASESVLVVFCVLLAITLQFREGERILQELGRPETVMRFALVVVICGLSFYYNDLYDFRAVRQRAELFGRLLQAVGFACCVLALVYYLKPSLSLGWNVAAIAGLSMIVTLLVWRLFLDITGLFRGPRRRILIVGTGPVGIRLTQEIISRPELNLRVVGFLDEKGENIGKSLVNPGIIGSVAEVERVATRERVDQVVLSMAERRGQTPLRDLLQLKFCGMQLQDAHSLYERLTGRIALDQLTPGWLIASPGFHKSRFLLFAKRFIDVGCSLFGLLLFGPLMGVIALLIGAETGRPILFRQQRVGLHGRLFWMLKFRSMHQQAEQDGPQWAKEADLRVTRVGRWLRKFRLDELPQFLNVLRGDMSLAGPRPEQPHFCKMLGGQIPFFALRHTVRPGVTGWAQTKYSYGASVEQARTKLEYDLFYIKNLSFALDLAILLETAKVVLWGKGAH